MTTANNDFPLSSQFRFILSKVMSMLRGFYRHILPVFVLFQLMGLFPIHLSSKNNSRASQLIWFYTLAMAITSVAIVGYLFWFRIQLTNVPVNLLIDQTMWISICISHSITCLEVFVTMPLQVQYVRNIYLVTKIFSRRLMRDNNVGALWRKCVYCSWVNFMTIVFVITVSLMVASDESWNDFRWIAFAWCAIQVRLVQVTTYVRIVNELLKELALELRRIKTIADPVKRCSRISDCKVIYSVIGDSVNQVNGMFGWSIMAIFTQNLCGITNTCYWIVYNVYYMQRFQLSVCELANTSTADLKLKIFSFQAYRSLSTMLNYSGLVNKVPRQRTDWLVFCMRFPTRDEVANNLKMLCLFRDIC